MFRGKFARLLLAAQTLKNGTILDGEFHRDGVLKSGIARLPDGRVYKGTFTTEGFPEPKTQLEEDGDIYIGAFNKQWQRHGDGVAYLLDGTKYTGRFENDELVEGKVEVPDGTSTLVFEGKLKDEQFVSGKLRGPDYTYEGEFRDNSPHGKGKLTFDNGGYQHGTFYRGKLHGTDCVSRLPNGYMYRGDFLAGVIHRGELRAPTYIYEGEFNESGAAHGMGRMEKIDVYPKLIFEGSFQCGMCTNGHCTDEHGQAIDHVDLRSEEGRKDPVSDFLSSLVNTATEDMSRAETENLRSYTQEAKEDRKSVV